MYRFKECKKNLLGSALLALLLITGSCSPKQDKAPVESEPTTSTDVGHNLEISGGMTPDSILIGDQVDLVVRATFPKGSTVLFPEFEEELAPGIEFVRASNLDTLKHSKEGTSTVERRYRITSFDSGAHALPPIPFLVQTSENTMDTVFFTPPFTLKVNTIALADDFAPFGIKDILSYPSEWWITALIILIVLLVVGVALWFILGREKIKKMLPLRNIPVRTPYEMAVAHLQRLRTEKLWERGQTKEYYTQLTDIVRQYIENRTGMPAMEKTSEEILAMLPETHLGDAASLERSLKELFYYADLAKFAKYIPTEADNELSWQRAYQFVETSKPVVEVIEEIKAES